MRDAIELLTAANRVRRDVAIERRLVQLRSDAHAQIDGSQGLASWPPEVEDLFAGIVGPPEVTPDQLTPESLRSGILHHGCLLVRGLVGTERVEQLVDDIDRAFAGYDATATGSGASTAPWFEPFDAGPAHNEHLQRTWVRNGGGVLAVDSPPTLFDIIETFEEAGIRDLVTAYLDEPPMLLAAKWTLRRIRPSEFGGKWGTDIDFHQDGSFMGADVRSVDLWLSLSHCGQDAPGLDVVPRRFDRIIGTGTDGALLGWTVSPSTARRVAEGAIVTPVFEPGDALFFDHMLLHRTGFAPEMTKDRHAIEAWFAAPSGYPDDQVPIAY